MNSQKGLIITIVVLLVIGLGLGVLIAKTRLQNPQTSSQTPNTSQTANVSSPSPEALSKELFNIPGPNATAAERDAFSAAVAQYAVETDTLDISNCIPDPVVLRVKDKSNVLVVNKSGINAKITVDPQHIFTIPANQQNTVNLDLGYGPGIYGYSCNDGAGVVGIFYLI